MRTLNNLVAFLLSQQKCFVIRGILCKLFPYRNAYFTNRIFVIETVINSIRLTNEY